MFQVWLLFHILETFLGLVCSIYHVIGFMDKEPLPHILLFCGTFFGFTLISAVGASGLVIGATPPTILELIVNLIGAILYIVSAIISMIYAEADFHLMYLSDFEEPAHPFFSHCRAQSIGAYFAGAIHLLNAVLAFDVIFLTSKGAVDSSGESESDEDDAFAKDKRGIRLYFLGKYIERKLYCFQWFEELCRRREPTSSNFLFRKNRESGLQDEMSSSWHANKRPERRSLKSGLSRIGIQYKDRIPAFDFDDKSVKTKTTKNFHAPQEPPQRLSESDKLSLQNEKEAKEKTSEAILSPSHSTTSVKHAELKPSKRFDLAADSFEAYFKNLRHATAKTLPESSKNSKKKEMEDSQSPETKTEDLPIKKLKKKESQREDLSSETDIEDNTERKSRKLADTKEMSPSDLPESKSKDTTETKPESKEKSESDSQNESPTGSSSKSKPK